LQKKKEENSTTETTTTTTTTDSKVLAGNTPKRKKKKKNGKKTEEDGSGPGFEKIADKLFGDKVHYVTTDPVVAKKLRSLGYIPVVDGVIPGVVGALLAAAPLRKQPEVTALLAPTSTILPDPDSAIQVLRLLDTLHPDLFLGKASQELEKDVASLKKMLQGLMRNLSTDLRNNLPLGLRSSRGSIPTGMYQ